MNQDFKSQDIMKDKLGYLKTDEIRAIYKACKTHRDRLLVRLLWMSGRRVSEILLLQGKDIDFDRALINWHILKKKRPMRAQKTIDKKSLDLLKNYCFHERITLDEYLISPDYDRTRPITRQRVFAIIRRLGKQAGIEYVGSKKIHPHHFRHSRAIRLATQAQTPADIKNIQKILEHSHLGMTEHYLGFLEEETRKLMEIE